MKRRHSGSRWACRNSRFVRYSRRKRVQVFSSNYRLYGDLSQRVRETLEQFSPDLEIYSIDEAFLSLAGFERRNLTDHGRQIRKTVKQWTGFPVSVGIAETKILAKLANRIAKQTADTDGVFDLLACPDREALLECVAVGDVWGIGPNYARLLTQQGITTAWQLSQADEHWIQQLMGVVGLQVVAELKGRSCLDLEPAPHPSRASPAHGPLADQSVRSRRWKRRCRPMSLVPRRSCGGKDWRLLRFRREDIERWIDSCHMAAGPGIIRHTPKRGLGSDVKALIARAKKQAYNPASRGNQTEIKPHRKEGSVMGRLKRNRVWWMSFMYQGRQVCRTTDKRLAESILCKVKVQISEGRFFETREEQTRTFGDMMDRYLNERAVLKAPKSHQRDRQALIHLRPIFGDAVLAEISPKLLAGYKTQRRIEKAQS